MQMIVSALFFSLEDSPPCCLLSLYLCYPSVMSPIKTGDSGVVKPPPLRLTSNETNPFVSRLQNRLLFEETREAVVVVAGLWHKQTSPSPGSWCWSAGFRLLCGSQRSSRLMTRSSVWMSQHEAEGWTNPTHRSKHPSCCCHRWGKLTQVASVFLMYKCFAVFHIFVAQKVKNSVSKWERFSEEVKEEHKTKSVKKTVQGKLNYSPARNNTISTEVFSRWRDAVQTFCWMKSDKSKTEIKMERGKKARMED